MSRDSLSSDSLADATKSRAKYSGHGNSKGAAGVVGYGGKGEFLSNPGDTAIINPHDHGYEKVHIGLAWDVLEEKDNSFMGKLFKKNKIVDVDLDLGCLYEMQDGKRGCIQAFGDLYGHYDNAPFIMHSGDEREGDEEGDDEYILLNGQKWPEIKRILFYAYIYGGAPNWAIVRPQVRVLVPSEKPLVVVPAVSQSSLAVCAIAGIENVRNGMKITNHIEYYPGHAEMDRAFGFGIEWSGGKKTPQL
jgi:tellurite resistance protein TerA